MTMDSRTRAIPAILLCLFFFFPVISEETNLGFVIAPPPVGYPQIERGQSLTQLGVNIVYVGVEVLETNLMIMGGTVFGNKQFSFSDHLALNGSAGLALLAGSEYNLVGIQTPFNLNLIVAPLKTEPFSLYVFGGLGATIGITAMTVTISQWVPYTSSFVDDDTSLRTTTLNGSANAGAQANIKAGALIISPFAWYSLSGGMFNTVMTSSMSYEYPSTEGDIDPLGNLIAGFDILYQPLNISLSSMIRKNRDYTLISVGYKWQVR